MINISLANLNTILHNIVLGVVNNKTLTFSDDKIIACTLSYSRQIGKFADWRNIFFSPKLDFSETCNIFRENVEEIPNSLRAYNLFENISNLNYISIELLYGYDTSAQVIIYFPKETD